MNHDPRSVEGLREHALAEVGREMERQIEKWGVQEHPSYKHADVLALKSDYITTERAKALCDMRLNAGECSWQDILNEEVLEARDEAIAGDIVALREELIQIAAVALSWVGSIDREYDRCPECGLLEGQHKMSCDTGWSTRHAK